MRVELTGDGPGSYALKLDGVDIAEGAVGADLHVDGETGRLVLELDLFEPLTVDAEVPEVVVPEHTGALLRRLGWIPPAPVA